MKAPLWTNSRLTELDRDRSVLRGIEFIYASASMPKQFEAFGHDFLWCFYSLSASASDPELKKRALRMGQERAKEWRKANSHVPLNADADAIANLAFGSLSADLLDIRDAGLKTELRTAASLHKPEEYFQFNPTLEPPPNDIPIDCVNCKSGNPRGSKICRKCAAELRMTDPYDILSDALITAYIGNRYGVILGGSYEDVAQWIPKMRPYPRHGKNDLRPTYSADYAVTYIVYTLNDYTLYKPRPEWLPQEYEYLKTNLKANIAMNDPETLGDRLSFHLRGASVSARSEIIRAPR